MGVTMRRIDGDPAFAGICGALHMTGPEGQRLATAAGERDGARAEPLHRDAALSPINAGFIGLSRLERPTG
jgi:hypothetical protein